MGEGRRGGGGSRQRLGREKGVGGQGKSTEGQVQGTSRIIENMRARLNTVNFIYSSATPGPREVIESACE